MPQSDLQEVARRVARVDRYLDAETECWSRGTCPLVRCWTPSARTVGSMCAPWH